MLMNDLNPKLSLRCISGLKVVIMLRGVLQMVSFCLVVDYPYVHIAKGEGLLLMGLPCVSYRFSPFYL